MSEAFGEPWSASDSDIACDLPGDEGKIIFLGPHGGEEHLAARAVACVNALAGIDDPAAFMGMVRRFVAETYFHAGGWQPQYKVDPDDLAFLRGMLGISTDIDNPVAAPTTERG